jgi:hypothetical protein
MNNKTDKKQPNNQPSDAELLMLISWKDQKAESETALKEFYNRYGPSLKQVIESVCVKHIKRYGVNLPKMVLSNTIVTLAENPDSILQLIDETKDSYEISFVIKGGLYQIAENELRTNIISAEKRFSEKNIRMLDSIDESKNALLKKVFEDLEEADLTEDEQQDDKMPDIEEINLIKTAMSMLDTRDSEILKTYLENDQFNKKMPRHVIKLLCNRWGTTPDNLRQIKSRLFKKIKDYVLKHKQKALISKY